MSVSNHGENVTVDSKSDLKNGIVVNTRAVCGVCKRLYRDPKILPCLHTFCADCIEQFEPFSVSAANEKRIASVSRESLSRDRTAITVLCPECDSEVDIPSSGADGLTTDHLALDEVFLETLMADHSVLCDLCSEGQADKRCEVCCVNLCEFCCQAHRRQKRTASHTVQCVQELKAQGRLSRPVLCSLHPGQELRLFCDTCDRPVCLECGATFHRDHRCCPVHDVIHRHGDSIRELIAGRLRPHLELLEECLRKVELSQETLLSRVEVTADEIRTFARGYASAVEAHCVSLLRHLEELRVQRRNQLQLQRAQLQQALCDARSGVQFAERLLTSGSEAEILTAKGVTLRRLSSLLESGYKPCPATVASDDGASICFMAKEHAGKVEGYPMVGVIYSKTLDLSKSTIEGKGVEQGRVGQQGHFTLVCRDSAGEQMGRGGGQVLVSILHKDKKSCTVDTTVVDNNDGSYSVSYAPVEPGTYSVWVCVKAQHVKGSPFTLNIQRKFTRHSGTFHCCTFCSSGGTKEARCGCPGTMPGAFQGCGHGHKGHPGKPHWSCCGNTVERSECLLVDTCALWSSEICGTLMRSVEV